MDKFDFLDLDKKFRHTFIQIKQKENNQIFTVYINNISTYLNENEEPDYFKATVTLTTGKKIVADSRYWDFFFSFPATGVVNFDKTVAIAFKIPARQWKKALCQENFGISFPTAEIVEKAQRKYNIPTKFCNDFSWSVKNIEQVFKNEYYSFFEAKRKLKTGSREACALSPSLFMTNSHYNNSFLLWRYYNIVAEINKKEVKYVLPMFEQEVRDFFRRNNVQ